jgi:hypothetical protein
VSSDVWNAPPGAIIFFAIGAYGHVSTRVDGGGDGMASARVLVMWGINAGRTDLANYLAQTGAEPLGWAWTNGANTYPFDAAGGDPVPIPTGEESMLIYANTDTNVWAAGIPYHNVWIIVPAGQGDAYVAISGHPRVDLGNADWEIARGLCTTSTNTDVRVYADTSTDAWYLIGPGVDYPIPPGEGDLFQTLFGARNPVDHGSLETIRRVLG